LRHISGAFGTLPAGRTPTRADWTRLSQAWRADVDARIEHLQRLRDQLDGCIGCGCLSLRKCALYNRDDKLATTGAGPRRLLVDSPQAAPR
jgi:MerR family transcriptional regulator, redox-sensitive transcriptional activator SoxR